MYISIIILSSVCFLLTVLCAYLFFSLKEANDYINDPNASFKIISHMCSKVAKGGDLERLHVEMGMGLKILEHRKSDKVIQPLLSTNPQISS